MSDSAVPVPDPADAAPPGAKGVLSHPPFARLWAAHTLSALGDRVHQVALTWWTLATTGSLALTGAMLIATTLPAVLLGPVAGTWADRWPRRRLMVACDLARGLLVFALAGLAAGGLMTPASLLVASALLAALTACFTPAAMSAVPALVPEEGITSATAWMEGSFQGMGLLGPAVGGLVVAAAGPAGAFAVNGASFLLSAALLAGLALPAPAGVAAEPFWDALTGGFRGLGRQPTIAWVLAGFAAVNLFTTPVLLFMPYFARAFAVGATGLGLMEAMLGGGMLVAAAIWARVGATRRFPVVAGGLGGVGAAILGMGLYPTYAVHLALLALAGLLMGSVNVVIVAYFQERVPAEELGRFFGLMTSLTMGLMPLAFGAYGLLAGVVAPATLLVGNGVAVVLLALGFCLLPGFRDA